MVVVNSAMIITYYQIGTIINQRKEWGNKFIQKLADDLKDYGKGYSYEQLKKMSQFAHFFSENEIRSQPVTQIPWSTLSRVIIQKSSSKEEALWYIDQAYKNRWSRAIDGLEKTETDNETMGILLCKTADNYVVETSFKGLKTPIGVSKYKLFEDLPAYLTNKLNSIDKAEEIK